MRCNVQGLFRGIVSAFVLALAASALPAQTVTTIESEVQFDSFGRVWRQLQKMPDGTWSVRETLHRGDGSVASASETVEGTRTETWSPAPVPNVTKYTYDTLGRVTRISPADDDAQNSRATTMTYTGAQQTTRSTPVQTANGLVGQTTTETRDWLGRLSSVTDPVGTSGTYSYDVGNRLTAASVAASGVTPQLRSFVYDGRGLLTSETHPELGASGGGSYTYTYDSRGQLMTRLGGHGPLTYEYDGAGRVAEISSDGTVWKKFVYGTANASGNWQLGKLIADERHNGSNLSGVRQKYIYGGSQGELTSRETLVCTGACLADETNVNEAYSQSFGYDPLGFLTSQQYPNLTRTQNGTTIGANPSFSGGYAFTQGMLTAVTNNATTTYAGLTYHPNGMVATVVHSGGVTDTIALAAQKMARPAQITSGIAGQTALWDQAYSYDPSGNITTAGADTFVYDGSSRLTSASVMADRARTQVMTYDAFGNMTSKNTDAPGGMQSPNLTTSAATNHLLSPNGSGLPMTAYDAAGAISILELRVKYHYDPLGMIVRTEACTNGDCSGTATKFGYWYTADDERIGSYAVSNAQFTWSIRGLDNKVLRDYELLNGAWNWKRDHIWREGNLLADITSAGTTHYSLDHLGTPRLATNATGAQLYQQKYFPFGEEATSPVSTFRTRMRFTGHERDYDDTMGATHADHMHARSYSALLGRFLSVDPQSASAKTQLPQTFNRYNYARNTPGVLVDPNGEEPLDPRYVQFLTHALGYRPRVDVQTGKLGDFVARAGITAQAKAIGPQIFLNSDVVADYRSATLGGISLIAHEVAHTRQATFLGGGANQVMAYFAAEGFNRVRGITDNQKNAFEKPAYAVGAGVREFLTANPEILKKIKIGIGLSADDVAAINTFFRRVEPVPGVDACTQSGGPCAQK